MSITPKNWTSFQHYKDRSPSWIKLHRGLLDDFAFNRLPVASRALAPILWLLASEYEDGCIAASNEEIAFRFRMPLAELEDALRPLIDSGFFVASEPLAERKPTACLEREDIGKKENKKEKNASEHFERFKAEYPKREGAQPWKPAEDKFLALVKSGVDPEEIIAGAVQCASDARRDKIFGTTFVPQATTWLNQKRFADYKDAVISAEKAAEALKSKFYAKGDSEQMDAWDRYLTNLRGRGSMRDKHGGWFFDSEWPPGYVPPEETFDPPPPSLRSMQ